MNIDKWGRKNKFASFVRSHLYIYSSIFLNEEAWNDGGKGNTAELGVL